MNLQYILMMKLTGLSNLNVVVKVREKSKMLDRFFGMSNYILFIEVSKFQAVAGDGVGNLKFSLHHVRFKIIIKLSSKVAK